MDIKSVRHLERDAAARAIAEVQRFWLPVFEAMQQKLRNDHETDLRSVIANDVEVARLRRELGLGSSPFKAERKRAQTRERVRRWRAARRA